MLSSASIDKTRYHHCHYRSQLLSLSNIVLLYSDYNHTYCVAHTEKSTEYSYVIVLLLCNHYPYYKPGENSIQLSPYSSYI